MLFRSSFIIIMDSEVLRLKSYLKNVEHLLCNWDEEISFELQDALECEKQLVNGKINSLLNRMDKVEVLSSDDSLSTISEESEESDCEGSKNITIDISTSGRKLKTLTINMKKSN